jgi:hypothetical protein
VKCVASNSSSFSLVRLKIPSSDRIRATTVRIPNSHEKLTYRAYSSRRDSMPYTSISNLIRLTMSLVSMVASSSVKVSANRIVRSNLFIVLPF